jgi:hypothetical protein
MQKSLVRINDKDFQEKIVSKIKQGAGEHLLESDFQNKLLPILLPDAMCPFT